MSPITDSSTRQTYYWAPIEKWFPPTLEHCVRGRRRKTFYKDPSQGIWGVFRVACLEGNGCRRWNYYTEGQPKRKGQSPRGGGTRTKTLVEGLFDRGGFRYKNRSKSPLLLESVGDKLFVFPWVSPLTSEVITKERVWLLGAVLTNRSVGLGVVPLILLRS